QCFHANNHVRVIIVNHDLSFEEGWSPQNQPTLCPRLLIFDQNVIITIRTDTLQARKVVCETQDPIPQSEYHAHLEGEIEESDFKRTGPNIRYWSDYSHVFRVFDQKSIQVIPDALESIKAGWSDTELMEGAFRLLVENCDNFQGLQMVHDTPSFGWGGGGSHAFLTSFRDEFLKAFMLNFSFSSGTDPNHGGINNIIINDALCLQSLHQLSDITFPILHLSRWSTLESSNLLQGLAYILYHTSGVISSLVETAMVPLRHRGSQENIVMIADHLNWQRERMFTDLSGNFLTSLSNKDKHVVFARRNVTQGLQDQDLAAVDAWCNLSSLQEPLDSSIHVPAYPMPTFFLSIFQCTRLTSIRMASSLVPAPSTSIPLMGYARFVEQTAMRRRSDGVLRSMGLESDNMKELASALMESSMGTGMTGG
ncbi:uncharacterized protein F5147DRAFT_723891, partial [Suillus discolor]